MFQSYRRGEVVNEKMRYLHAYAYHAVYDGEL